jgi:hypothetical protein
MIPHVVQESERYSGVNSGAHQTGVPQQWPSVEVKGTGEVAVRSCITCFRKVRR